MYTLELIISTIRFGVMLARAHLKTLIEGPMTADEVHAMLVMAEKAAPEPVPDWPTSIVDLMKLLGLNPTKAARADLWRGTGHRDEYTGTAEQNIELHGTVMKAVADRLVAPAVHG